MISLVGLALRIDQAVTFDALHRGADYERHLAGVTWMMQHWRPFHFTPALDPSIGYQPPLWYAFAAAILLVTHSARAIAGLAVVGWSVRQFLLARLLKEAIPGHRWAASIALTVHTFLPISVQTDGEANPEVLHTSLFVAGVYALWRMERQAAAGGRVRLTTAAAFGALAGLALWTKSTAIVLPMAAVVMLGWRARRLVVVTGWPEMWRRLARPALVAAAAWCLVAGWWCGPNLVKYRHPFPHAWDQHFPDELGSIADTPILYRRPLGWVLPFFWGPYWSQPIMKSATEPRTNVWAMLVAGTWSDSINRGFCRLEGGGWHREYWDHWPISHRCVVAMTAVFRLGCLVAAATVLATLGAARDHLRTADRSGSLVLPTVVLLGVLFPVLFAIIYPVDGTAVVNGRYLLPVSTAMSACLGIGLANSPRPRLAQGLVMLLVVAIAALVMLERWGG